MLKVASLPVIDLAVGTSAIHAKQLHRAASEYGFFYLRNHGVSLPPVFSALKSFFESRKAEKMKYHQNNTGCFRGYVGFFEQGGYGLDESDSRASTDVERQDLKDFKEVFHCGHSISREDPRYDELVKKGYYDLLFSPNVWLDSIKFNDVVQQYYEETLDLSNRMLELFALSLNMERNTLLNMSVKSPVNSMNCVHYPPLSLFPTEKTLSEEQLGIGSHTDFEAFTLLAQSGTEDPCLEIFHQNAWQAVPPLPETLVVNIGDLLARLSGDVYKSTVS